MSTKFPITKLSKRSILTLFSIKFRRKSINKVCNKTTIDYIRTKITFNITRVKFNLNYTVIYKFCSKCKSNFLLLSIKIIISPNRRNIFQIFLLNCTTFLKSHLLNLFIMTSSLSSFILFSSESLKSFLRSSNSISQNLSKSNNIITFIDTTSYLFTIYIINNSRFINSRIIHLKSIC